MLSLVFRRLLQAIPVVFIASIIVFSILQFVPGDPAVNIAGPDASDQDVEVIRERLGLNRSIPEQYLTWMSHAVRGDLGASFRNDRPVSELLGDALVPTLQLTLSAFLIEVVLGVTLGVMAGTRLRSAWDWGLSAFTMLGIAIPHFVLGLVLLYVVSFRFGWLPVGGSVPLTEDPIEGVKYLLLPALVLGLTGAAVLARFVRTSIAEVMNQDYVRTARAKGLRARTVVIQHALRNGLIPVVTVMALQFATLLTGSVVVENVFSRPGVGRLVVGAVQARDYPVVQGSLLFLVVGFILVNLTADLLYGFLDPRIRVN
jgi:peptide/nickel transport system permease protein